MAKPESIRITLDHKNRVKIVEVKLPGKDEWVETKPGKCKSGDCVDPETDTLIRVGQVAEPNSCVFDPRCESPPTLCSIYAGGCYTYSC